MSHVVETPRQLLVEPRNRCRYVLSVVVIEACPSSRSASSEDA
jgi:hypothetical protein